MLNLAQFIWLIGCWLVGWGVYNFFLLPREIASEKTPDKIAIYFGLLSLLTTFIFSLKFSVAILIIYGLIWCWPNSIAKGRISNSLFQMCWLVCVYWFFNQSLIITAIVFWIGHWPIWLVQHLEWKAKILLIGIAGLGGILFSLVLWSLEFPYNFVFIIFIHMAFYEILRPWDERYSLGLIN